MSSMWFFSQPKHLRYLAVYLGLVVVLLVATPIAWFVYGLHYNNSHPEDTVGGPVTVMVCIFAGVISDAAIAIVAPLLWGIGLLGWKLVRTAQGRRLAHHG